MKKYDAENLAESERERILSNPDLYRKHIRDHFGGLESSMIEGFYKATAKNPKCRGFAKLFRIDFMYEGPLFGKNKATLAVYPENEGYDEILENPRLYMKAFNYDSKRKLYLISNGEISIANQLQMDEEKILPIRDIRKSIYFESRILDLFEQVIKAGKR
jgi:hypothetical protein